MALSARLSRRRLLYLAASLPVGALLAACGADDDDAPAPEPTHTATPEPPFVVAAGEEKRLLMPGTPYETPLYVFGSGLAGPVLMVLGGVHGNVPGGWLAAERLQERLRPATGAFLIVPRANKLAVAEFVRTTPELGDLNRLYPGQADGPPMAQMARQIFETLREFRVSLLLDLHESWAFYKDRTATQTGTAYLGQTIASSTSQGIELARGVAEAVNQRIRAPQEELIPREWPPRGFALSVATPGASTAPEPGTTGPTAAFGGGRSSLGLSSQIPGLIAILVEMGQQQPLERRIALHVDVVEEAARRIGLVSV